MRKELLAELLVLCEKHNVEFEGEIHDSVSFNTSASTTLDEFLKEVDTMLLRGFKSEIETQIQIGR